MLLFSFLLNILVLSKSQLTDIDFVKCCPVSSVIVLQNDSYLCGNDVFNSLKILPSSKNVITDLCVDIFDNKVHLFKGKFNFTKIKLLSLKFHNKCCPLNYVYNIQLHSCDEIIFPNQTNVSSYRFIRIGLPNCKIIEDRNRISQIDLSQLNAENYCLDRTENHLEILRECRKDFEVCNTIRCIRKCCPDGHSFVNGSHCKATFIYGLDLNFSEFIDQTDEFAIIHGYKGKIYLQPSDWEFHLDSRGVFRLFDEKIGNEIYEPTDDTYCIEHATKNGIDFGHRIFRKLPEKEMKYVINGYIMIVSSAFLLATVVIYIALGESRKLFGKILISFCCSLMFTFFLLIYTAFHFGSVKPVGYICRIFGFLLLYAEYSTFLWLLLLGFDIYLTFGTGKIRNRSPRSDNLKRFLCYSVYGWGLPLLVTLIPLSFTYVDVLPGPIQIQIGVYRCAIDRFDGNYADLLFRTVPVSIIEITSLILYVKTVKCCIDVTKQIEKMNDNKAKKRKRFLIEKERFLLCSKLSIIMGISYMFEVVSSLYDFSGTKFTKYLEIAWDIFNCLQGVFIFFIFICKKETIRALHLNVGLQKLKSLSFSSRTTSSSRRGIRSI